MSKPVYRVTHCENCDAQLKADDYDESDYEASRVNVTEMKVLLPKKVFKRSSARKQFTSVSGIFCNPQCLSDYIKNVVLKNEERGMMLTDELGLPTADAEPEPQDVDQLYADLANTNDDLPF